LDRRFLGGRFRLRAKLSRKYADDSQAEANADLHASYEYQLLGFRHPHEFLAGHPGLSVRDTGQH
jgi:hypothetical protein